MGSVKQKTLQHFSLQLRWAWWVHYSFGCKLHGLHIYIQVDHPTENIPPWAAPDACDMITAKPRAMERTSWACPRHPKQHLGVAYGTKASLWGKKRPQSIRGTMKLSTDHVLRKKGNCVKWRTQIISNKPHLCLLIREWDEVQESIQEM